NKDMVVKVDQVPVEKVINTLGAGDAFHAVAMQRLFETKGDLEQSLLWGNAGGSFAVEHLGAHEKTSTREELEQRLQQTSPKVEIRRLNDKPQSQGIYYAPRTPQSPVLLAA
ncbi:MAG: PfkB family carbohydrate kinase, partial [Candidatus Levyibacteriota bacterium]